ncbi:hypothetical protein Tco_1534494 [Tanacetum coccineum]
MTRVNGVLHGPWKKKLHCVKTYDMVKGKCKNVCAKVAQFCGVYNIVTWMARHGAGDRDYTQLTLLEYQAQYGVPYTLVHCWAGLRDCHKWKKVELLNVNAKKEDKNRDTSWRQRGKGCAGSSMSRDRAKKKGVTSSASSTFGNEEALARLKELELEQ